jgi:hypothetical protein
MSLDSAEPSVIEREPVAVYSAAALIVVTLANALGVVLDLSVVENVALAIPVLIAAISARQKVTPVEFPKFGSTQQFE